MPALPSSLIEPLWDQFAALIPPRVDTHPLGCHRPRIGDRIVFDKLVQVLVLGATYDRIADASCSATTLRTRRDEWISDGLFEELEDICLRAYDQIVGLDLGDLTVDGCIVKAQHDLRPQRQRLRRLRPPRPPHQLRPLLITEDQLGLRSTCSRHAQFYNLSCELPVRH